MSFGHGFFFIYLCHVKNTYSIKHNNIIQIAMNKKLYLGAALLIGTVGAFASPITPQQALQRASSQTIRKIKGVAELSRDLLYTYRTSYGDAAVYVFGNSDNKGYILLSADDAMAPVLGYADSGVFEEENMPPQMKEWLAGYARQQEYASQMGLPAYVSSQTDGRKAVEPLMKTTWNQNAPYNLLTPKVDNSQTPTGCVATAMAQVMKYWNYPAAGVGTGVITNPETGRNETMRLDEDFLWEEMLDSYSGSYTDDQADAVAYLMKACGYSVNMSYAVSVSGSFSVYAAKALIDNFKYNPNIRYYQRDYMEATEWDTVIYNEISNGRPILYGAQSTSGGHEFVCDGYSGDGYYHFNWGWGGMSDGYFILDSLNPGAVGTGGGSGGGFNYKQDIVVGIQPEQEMIYEPRLTQFGELNATAKDLSLTLRITENGSLSQWVNAGLEELTGLSIGVMIEPVDKNNDAVYVVCKTQRLSAPEYTRVTNGLSISYSGIQGQITAEIPENLPDGKYKVTVSTLASGSEEWVPVFVESEAYNYVYVTKTGNSIETEVLSEAVVTLDSAELTSALYYGSVALFTITATNNSDKEMTSGFYPELSVNGVRNLIGDGIVLTLQPHETVTTEFSSQFRLVSGVSAPTSKKSYDLRWFDPNISSTAYYDIETEVVTLNVSNSRPTLSITRFDIEGVETKVEYVAAAGYEMEVYQVPDVEEIQVNVDLTCSRGFFGYPLYFVVFKTSDLNADITRSVFDPMKPLEGGDSCDMTSSLNLSFGELNEIYAGFLFYQATTGMVQAQDNPICFKLTGAAGIEEIGSYDNEVPVYYNLQGQEVKNPRKGDILIKKQSGKTTKIVY